MAVQTAPATSAPSPIRLREIADLPGPRAWPVVGNQFQIDRPRLHLQMEAWSREHGDLFRLRLPGRTFLAVADHKLVMALLRDRPQGFRRSSRFESVTREMGLDIGVFGANGEAWQRQRRLVMGAFDPGHVKAYFPSLRQVTLRLQARWQRAVGSGAAIDLQADLMRFTVDAISGLAFGVDTNTLESDGDVIQQHLDQIFPATFRRLYAPVPYWRWLKLPADRRLDRSVAEVNQAISGFVSQARERLRADPARRERPANLLEAMLVTADAPGSGVDDRDVAGNVLTMLLAGEDTTANTLGWMIWLLHRNPAALAKARDEVRRLAPDATAFEPESMAALDYLEACAHETMRLKPVAPFQIVEALHDTTVADVRVPSGTLIWAAMRRDSLEDRYFENAAAFIPERWLGADGAGDATSASNSAKRISMPFGGGPRVCPGRYLALLEMKMAMAMLLGSFEIDAVETPDGGEAREHLAFTMAAEGLRMRLRARE